MDLWTVQEVVNGGKIKHLQFTEFSEGHGSMIFQPTSMEWGHDHDQHRQSKRHHKGTS